MDQCNIQNYKYKNDDLEGSRNKAKEHIKIGLGTRRTKFIGISNIVEHEGKEFRFKRLESECSANTFKMTLRSFVFM